MIGTLSYQQERQPVTLLHKNIRLSDMNTLCIYQHYAIDNVKHMADLEDSGPRQT